MPGFSLPKHASSLLPLGLVNAGLISGCRSQADKLLLLCKGPTLPSPVTRQGSLRVSPGDWEPGSFSHLTSRSSSLPPPPRPALITGTCQSVLIQSSWCLHPDEPVLWRLSWVLEDSLHFLSRKTFSGCFSSFHVPTSLGSFLHHHVFQCRVII